MRGPELLRETLAEIERNFDDGMDVPELERALADKHIVDRQSAALDWAKGVIKRAKTPGQTEISGQLAFEGMPPYGYEPNRLVADDDKHIIENAKATPVFKAAEAHRKRVAAERTLTQAQRREKEIERFNLWASRQLLAGTPESEITFGNFVKSAGVWSEDTAPAEESDLDAA